VPLCVPHFNFLSMRKVSVSGSLRENVGKKDAKRLRREGLVPCVIYGGKEQLQFATPASSFKDIVYTPLSCIIKLDVDGKKFDAILQDIQFHPVNDKILHVDFLEIFPDKEVKLSVPIKVVGSSPGVIKGGKMQTKLRKLVVQALPGDLPNEVEINISKLEIGDAVKVGDLSLGKISFVDPASSVVVMVKSARAAMMAPVGDEDEEGEEGEEGAEGEAAEGEAAEGEASEGSGEPASDKKSE
jgi:large subunit ribosomal protein L25